MPVSDFQTLLIHALLILEMIQLQFKDFLFNRWLDEKKNSRCHFSYWYYTILVMRDLGLHPIVNIICDCGIPSGTQTLYVAEGKVMFSVIFVCSHSVRLIKQQQRVAAMPLLSVGRIKYPSPLERTWDQWKYYGMKMGTPRKDMGPVEVEVSCIR